MDQEENMAEFDEVRKSAEKDMKTAGEAMEKGSAAAKAAAREAEHSYTAAAEGIRELNHKLLEMAQANAMAGMEFTREVLTAKGPADVAKVCSKHAQQQFERLTSQSQELASVTQKIAISSTEPFMRGFGQMAKAS